MPLEKIPDRPCSVKTNGTFVCLSEVVLVRCLAPLTAGCAGGSAWLTNTI